jgi:hypothetical protein
MRIPQNRNSNLLLTQKSCFRALFIEGELDKRIEGLSLSVTINYTALLTGVLFQALTCL